MNLDTIPIFKPFQALTADHLNDLREFLDREDRLTRRALIGIGVMCGFELDLDLSGRVHISKGVAVTSEGYVIAEDAVVCDRVLPYEVPLPTGEDVPPAQVAEARYPFLFPDRGPQIDAWEMLTTEAAFGKLASQWGAILATDHARANRKLAKRVERKTDGRRDQVRELVREIAFSYAFQVESDWRLFLEALAPEPGECGDYAFVIPRYRGLLPD